MELRSGHRNRLLGQAELSYGIASCREELEAAYLLACAAPTQAGRADGPPPELNLTIRCLLPETTTFVARAGQAVVATVSLVEDSALALPMDPTWPADLSALRAKGCRLGEVMMLGDRRSELRRALTVLLTLSRLMFHYARDQAGLTDLCVAVELHHELFFRKYLHFRSLGGSSARATVNGRPAVGLRLSFAHVEHACRTDARLWRLFHAQCPSNASLEKVYQMTDEDAHYFLVERSNALAQASPRAVERVRAMFPMLDAQEALV
jgi:hypothetical protein